MRCLPRRHGPPRSRRRPLSPYGGGVRGNAPRRLVYGDSGGTGIPVHDLPAGTRRTVGDVCKGFSMTTMPDGRPVPPPQADERAMLESWLDFQRATLALKCEGLDDARLRRAAVPPSPMTLLGLVQHMAEVERNWFQRMFSGQDVPSVYTESEDGSGFTLSPERGIDDVLAIWRAEVARGRELTAAASLTDCGELSERAAAFVGDNRVSLRWILIHLIEEYARHNGHADLLRERIDGVTGV